MTVDVVFAIITAVQCTNKAEKWLFYRFSRTGLFTSRVSFCAHTGPVAEKRIMEGEGEAGSAAAAKSSVTIDKQLLAVLQRLISGQSDDVPEEYKDLKQLDRQSAFDRYVSVVDGLVSTWKTLPKEVDAAVLRRQNENLVQVVDTLKTELVQLRGKISKNVELENEVDRLCRELDEATGGVNKRGYLNKYRVRENIIGTKWVKRFFVLSGSSLRYVG